MWCAKLLTMTAIIFTWANADFDRRAAHSTSEMDHFRPIDDVCRMSASLIGRLGSSAFRLSTTIVSMSLAGSCFSSESAPKAVPSWDSKTRWNNLSGGLAARVTVGPSGSANSPHPSSREGHLSTARWSSSFLLLDLILHGFHAATGCSLVQRNSVPSTQMRCMITANRRASATIAFFIPRRLAICIAQALSQDHFFARSML